MRDKMDLPEEVTKRILEAGTLDGCFVLLSEALPGIWPDVLPSQLPDEVNRHMLAVMKRNARNSPREKYDPPADPKEVFGIPYRE